MAYLSLEAIDKAASYQISNPTAYREAVRMLDPEGFHAWVDLAFRDLPPHLQAALIGPNQLWSRCNRLQWDKESLAEAEIALADAKALVKRRQREVRRSAATLKRLRRKLMTESKNQEGK